MRKLKQTFKGIITGVILGLLTLTLGSCEKEPLVIYKECNKTTTDNVITADTTIDYRDYIVTIVMKSEINYELYTNNNDNFILMSVDKNSNSNIYYKYLAKDYVDFDIKFNLGDIDDVEVLFSSRYLYTSNSQSGYSVKTEYQDKKGNGDLTFSVKDRRILWDAKTGYSEIGVVDMLNPVVKGHTYMPQDTIYDVTDTKCNGVFNGLGTKYPAYY